MNSVAPPENDYVGFWIRFLAFCLDSLWAVLLISPIVVFMFGEVDLQQLVDADAAELQTLLIAYSRNSSVETLLTGLVVLLFWIFWSATPGKMVFSAIIVDAKTGNAPGTGQLVIRYLGYFVNMFALGLGFLWVAWDHRKQGWHDKMAGTVVIKRSKN